MSNMPEENTLPALPETNSYPFLGRKEFQERCLQAIARAEGELYFCLNTLDSWQFDQTELHDLLKEYWRKHTTHHVHLLLCQPENIRELECLGKFNRLRTQYAHKLTCYALDNPREAPEYQALFANNLFLTQINPKFFSGTLQIAHDTHSRAKITDLKQRWGYSSILGISTLGL